MVQGIMDKGVGNFVVIETVYGKFIVNRHCANQAEHLIKTGRPHIEQELRNILTVIQTLPGCSVTVDAGANIGLVSVPIAQQVKEIGGIVHAFEVQRPLFHALCGSAALNDLENLYVHHVALGASKGRLKVPLFDYGTEQDFGLCTLVKQQDIAFGEAVEMAAIDDLGLPRLDFLKVDVEGMEIEVLSGATQTIHDHLPWCWVEYWKVDLDEIKNQFAGMDYRFFLMDELNVLCAPTKRLRESSLSVEASDV